jgi:hypothetical protein
MFNVIGFILCRPAFLKRLRVPMAVLFGFLLSACGGGGGGGGGAAPAPAPQSGVIALPKTGQTTCFDAANASIPCAGTGQDGELQTGVAEPIPRFTVGTGVGTTDQCVTDNLTGLMWTRNANLPAAPRTWQQSLDYANALSLCGFDDWRLSNRKELRSLINHSLASSATTLNTSGFANVQAFRYWSSSSYTGNAIFAWVVSMGDGSVELDTKNFNYSVWPVRAGQ